MLDRFGGGFPPNDRYRAGLGRPLGELVGVTDEEQLESEQAGKQQHGDPGDRLDRRLARVTLQAGTRRSPNDRDRSTPPARSPVIPERGPAVGPKP